MTLESKQEAYGKLVKEDENFWYFEGKGEFGVAVSKHAYWMFPDIQSKDDHDA